MTATAAVLACLVLAALAAFQVLLVAGRPLGRFAWGGAHEVLPTRLRVGSAVSVVLYALFATVILDAAELTDVLPEAFSDVGIWVLTAYFALGTVMNAVSRSKPERLVMTPTALVLAVLCLCRCRDVRLDLYRSQEASLRHDSSRGVSMLRRSFARQVLRLSRWRTVGRVPSSGVLVGAPHTSNWDWVAMLLLMWGDGIQPRVLIKREAFHGPLAPLLRATGGIPLDRKNPGDTVRRLLSQAHDDEPFLLVLAAEGTRTKGTYWKSGFYWIAKQAGLPISLGFIDGPTRTIGFGPTFTPTGNVAADMDLVRAFYADKRGVHPERRTEPRLREEDSPRASGKGEAPVWVGRQTVPGPLRNAQAIGHVARWVAGHGRGGRPGEVVVQHGPGRVVLEQSDVRQRLVEAGDRPAVHLLVRSVAAVDAHHRGLVAVAVGVGRRATECLGPVGREALAVLRVETVAERVADHLVRHHPGMPRTGQPEQALVATRGLVHRVHVGQHGTGVRRTVGVHTTSPRLTIGCTWRLSPSCAGRRRLIPARRASGRELEQSR